MIMTYIRFLALFVIMLLLFLASPNGMLPRLGLEHTPLIAALAAVIIAGVMHGYRLVFALATVLLAVAANLAPEVAAELGFDRDYAIAALLAVLITPWVVSKLDE